MNDVVSTKRKGLVHFQDMKPVEFINFCRDVSSVMKGKLVGLKTMLKIDGLGFRFGRDAAGNVFVESSRSGPIFKPGAFSEHAAHYSIDPDVLARAEHYDNLASLFRNREFIRVVPPDRKVVCEVFYNPMGVERDSGIVFVTVEYDKSKLGSLMTLLPHKVLVSSTGDLAPDQDKVLSDLIKESTSEIKIISPNLKMGEIDVTEFIDPILSLGPEAIKTLVSRKPAEADSKAAITAVINKTKEELAEYILEHPEIVGKYQLGPDIEGLIVSIRGKEYKFTTPEFKQAIKNKRESR